MAPTGALKRSDRTDGEKNIEDIEVGDEVYSSDVETGEVGLKHVLWTKVAET